MAPHPRRDFVVQRAGLRCEYCHTPELWLPLRLHVDHVIARQHGGSDDDFNLAATCRHCNACKGTNIASVDLVTHELVRLFDPRRDRWGDHFVIAGDAIVGRTPKGRATAALLAMNSVTQIQHRRLMRQRRMDITE